METIKNLFRNQMPSAVAAAEKRVAASFDLSALDQPGRNVQRPSAVALPETPAPAVIAPAPVPVIAAPTCPTCGQRTPEAPPVVASAPVQQPVAIAEPVVATQTPLDAEWNSYEKTDLLPRTSSQIQLLIPLETEESRMNRIINDKMRYAHQQGR